MAAGRKSGKIKELKMTANVKSISFPLLEISVIPRVMHLWWFQV